MNPEVYRKYLFEHWWSSLDLFGKWRKFNYLSIALGDLKFNWIIIHFADNLNQKECMCNKGGVILDPSQYHCMDMENMLSF